MIFVELLTLAKKVTNYALDATGGGLWATTTKFKVTCPAGKRWFVIAGSINRAVSSTLDTRIYDESDVVLYMVDNQGAATGITSFPNKTANALIAPTAYPLVMDAGDYLDMSFGTAQNASSWASFTVLEVDV